MPISLVCDDCEKQMKIADTFAGKKIKCPQCKSIISVPAAEADEEEEETTKPSKAASKTALTTKPAVKKGKPAVADDDEDEDEKPAKKSSGKGSKKEDFTFEDDDEEDKDDDEEDTKSKKKKKDKKKKKFAGAGGGSKKGLFIGLGVGGGVLGLVGVFLLLAYFIGFWPFGAGGATINAEAKYFPDDVTSIDSTRTGEFRKTKYYQELKSALSGAEDKGELSGIKVEDIERTTHASGNDFKDHVTIISTKKAIKAEDIKAAFKSGQFTKDFDYTEETVGSYKLYVHKIKGFGGKEIEGGMAFCVPESHILLTGNPETLRKVLKRDKKPEMSAGMKKAFADASFSNTTVHVSSTKSLGILSASGKDRTSQEGSCMMTDYGSSIKHKIIIYYKDTESAEKAKKDWEEDLKKEPLEQSESSREARKSASISRSGSTVTVTYSVKEQTAINDIKKIRGQ